MEILIIVVVLGALYFDFTNGWNDSANAIATVVATRVLNPLQAILLAAVLNFVGALAGQAVAKVIAYKIIHKAAYDTVGSVDGQVMVLAAVLAAAGWITVVTRKGLPVSGSHSLIGGLLGAGLAMGGVSAVNGGGIQKVLLALLLSPLFGLIIGFGLMTAIMWLARKATARGVNRLFGKLQILSVSWMAFAHGQNDAQKAMGIITLALFAGNYIGPKPDGTNPDIPLWVVIVCALAMALGTAAGGWRVMATVGQGLTRLKPVQGFAAETAASIVLAIAASIGLPVSTTHTITASIMGVGSTSRASAVRWGVGKKIAAAWIYTFPATMVVGAIIFVAVQAVIGS
jgi:PiT family inorganic phosphate transporter